MNLDESHKMLSVYSSEHVILHEAVDFTNIDYSVFLINILLFPTIFKSFSYLPYILYLSITYKAFSLTDSQQEGPWLGSLLEQVSVWS